MRARATSETAHEITLSSATARKRRRRDDLMEGRRAVSKARARACEPERYCHAGADLYRFQDTCSRAQQPARPRRPGVTAHRGARSGTLPANLFPPAAFSRLSLRLLAATPRGPVAFGELRRRATRSARRGAAVARSSLHAKKNK